MVQTSAQVLEAPLALLTLVQGGVETLKASWRSQDIPSCPAGLAAQVVQQQTPLAISAMAGASWTGAYLGVPWLTSTGECLGALAIVDNQPRQFLPWQIEFLKMTARWGASEYERSYKAYTAPGLGNQLKLQLLAELAQDLRTPLTAIVGMSSILGQEVYGPLTAKQKQYLEITHHSGQYLAKLVNQIVDLTTLSGPNLTLAATDVRMLCQRAAQDLGPELAKREQEIALTVEPGLLTWNLDREKVRQILQQLLHSLIQTSSPTSTLRMHVSRRHDRVQFMLWATHPWLGENPAGEISELPLGQLLTCGLSPDSRELFGLQFSHYLVHLHRGAITIQGSRELGYRYLVSLPRLG